MHKVMITMPDELLETLDAEANKQRQNRSEFIREAVDSRLSRLQEAEFEAVLAEGYTEMADEDLKDAQGYLGVTQELSGSLSDDDNL